MENKQNKNTDKSKMCKIIKPDFTKSVGSFLDMPFINNKIKNVVHYTDELAKYMKKANKTNILIKTFKPKAYFAKSEIDVSLISNKRAQELIESGCNYAVGHLGFVLIAKDLVPHPSSVIRLSLDNFLFFNTIGVSGIKENSLFV